jgi:hypothetical protein
MSFAFHGNYCGPGWTAGKYMDAENAEEKDFDVPAVDEMDAVCKTHDYTIWKSYKVDLATGRTMRKQADTTFFTKMNALAVPGYKDEMMAYAVWAGGPGAKLRTGGKSFFNLPCQRKWPIRKKSILDENKNLESTRLMRLLKSILPLLTSVKIEIYKMYYRTFNAKETKNQNQKKWMSTTY